LIAAEWREIEMTHEERYSEARMAANDRRFNDVEIARSALRNPIPFVSPFCEHVRFCKEHNEHTDVVAVNRCEFCYCEAFRAGKEAGKIDRVRGYRSEYSSLVERAPSYTQCYAKGYNEGQRI
jgi:hypothetical protein